MKKWLYYLLVGMYMDKVKIFYDHSMTLREMTDNLPTSCHFWTPGPASFRVNYHRMKFLSKRIFVQWLISRPVWWWCIEIPDSFSARKSPIGTSKRSSRYETMVFWIPKLFWPTVRKNCSSDREKLLKF